MAQAVIGALRVNLGIDSAQFETGLKNAQGKLDGFERALKRGALTVGALGVAAASAGAAIGTALTKASLETIDAQSKLAARVGASVAAIQALEHASDLAGVSHEQLAKALEKLNERLGEAARKGAGPAYEALKRLNIEAENLASLDADQRLAMLADRMAEFGYTTAQQADTLRQFGVRNAELINLLQGGGDAIRAARQEIQDFGLAVSDVDAKTIERANDAMSKISKAMTAIGNQIAVRLAPVIEVAADEMVELAKSGGGAGAVIDQAMTMAIAVISKLNTEIYRGRIFIDDLIGSVLDGIDTLAGMTPKAISWLSQGLLTPEDLGYKELEHEYGKLRHTLEEPPSFEEWMQWYDGLRTKAEETSKAIIEALETGNAPPGEGSGGLGLSEADQTRLQQMQDQRAQELEFMRQSLLTEAEYEQNAYAERMIALQDFLEQKMLTQQEYDELSERAKEEHEERMRNITQQSIDMELRARRDMINRVSGLMGALGSVLQSAGEENFQIVKALSLAQAILKGYEAVTSAYAAGSVYGPATAAAYAGIAAAATAAQIAQIAATQPTSKGTTSSAPAASAPAVGSARDQGVSSSLYIEGIDPSALYSGAQVRQLAERLVEYQRDGGTVLFSDQ